MRFGGCAGGLSILRHARCMLERDVYAFGTDVLAEVDFVSTIRIFLLDNYFCRGQPNANGQANQ